MATGLLIALIVGAAATAGAGILSRANERQEAKDKANYQKEQLALQTETNLGMLDKDLAAQKDSDFTQATAIERGALGELTAGMQQTYIEQLGAESQHMDLMSTTAQEKGAVQAQEGMSGARSDITLGSIVSADQSRRVKESRSAIDRGVKTSVGIGQMNFGESKTRAKTLRERYSEGSAVMDLYNFKKQQIQKGDTLESGWLDDVIEDNTYNWQWAMADVFGVAGAASSAVASAYGMGAIGGGAKSNLFSYDGAGSLPHTTMTNYSTWSGTAGYRSR